MPQTNFKDTLNYSARRYIRGVVKNSDTLTSKQKDITTYLLNLWFRHYNGPKGYIHPSKNLICKKVGCSKITAQHCLRLLRDGGAIISVGHASRSGKRATRYSMDVMALMRVCGIEPLKHIDADLIPVFQSFSKVKNYPSSTHKMIHQINPQIGLEINPCISNAEHRLNQNSTKVVKLFSNGDHS